MKQLTGLDATFLYLETPTNFGHVSGLAIYERPDDPDFSPYQAAREMFESQIDMLEPFRRRVVEVPFGIDRPYWIEDPNFDLDYHLRHLAIPAPGDNQQLAAQVARIIGRPCDRSKPLWECYVLEGLESGDFALLTKIHHATVDGAAGAMLSVMLLDNAPDTPLAVPGELPPPDSVPSEGEMWLRGIGNLVRSPDRVTRIGLRLAQQVAEAARVEGAGKVVSAARNMVSGSRSRPRDDRDSAPEVPSTSAPSTSLNKMISAHRRVAFGSVELDRIKEIKNAAGVTLNDVVMAACSGALRKYLAAKDDLPEDPLIGMIPVSIRTGDEADPWTNRVSGIFCALPTHLEDPTEQMAFVHEAMVAAKSDWDLLPADMMVDIADMAPPVLAARAARVAAALRIADRLNPPMNLIISNVPGPRNPLYLRGAKMKHNIPVSTIADGQALNITVQSYLNTLDFGLVADRDIVPDLWDLCDLCVEEVEVIAKAVGV
nr:putative wax ester synthase/acyl-CoA:diacylglycerol acyltransferase [uncultured bacterium]